MAEMAQAPSIEFAWEMDWHDVALYSVEGVQRVRGGWSATKWSDDPTTAQDDHNLVMHGRSEHGTTWMQIEDWPAPMTGCWLELEPGDVPIDLYGLQPDITGYAQILLTLDPDHFTGASGSEFSTELPLVNAQLLSHGTFIELIDLDDASWSTTKIPLTVTVEDGGVISISMEATSIADSVVEAGGAIAAPGRTSFDGVVSQLTLRPSTKKVARPPADDLVVTGEEIQRGC